MFDWDNTKYPRTWREMSFDFKCMFAYHIAMMAMMVAGAAISAAGKITIAAVILAGASVFSIRHRQIAGWHWRPPGWRGVLGAVGGIVLGGVFVAATLPMASPHNSNFLPWYLALFGILTMNALWSLKIAYLAEADFLADCGDPASEVTPRPHPQIVPWKRTLRTLFSVLFMLVWLDGVGSFYLSSTTLRDSSAVPTATASVPFHENGKTVYVTAARKQLLDWTTGTMMIGIPATMALAALLHFVVGIRMFPNVPMRGETADNVQR